MVRPTILKIQRPSSDILTVRGSIERRSSRLRPPSNRRSEGMPAVRKPASSPQVGMPFSSTWAGTSPATIFSEFGIRPMPAPSRMASASSSAKPVRVSRIPAATRMADPTKPTAGCKPRPTPSTKVPRGRPAALTSLAKLLIFWEKFFSVRSSPRIRIFSATVLASGSTAHRMR